MTFQQFVKEFYPTLAISGPFTTSSDVVDVYNDTLEAYGYSKGPHIEAFVKYMHYYHGYSESHVIKTLNSIDHYTGYIDTIGPTLD